MRILSELEYYPISCPVDSLGRTTKDRAFFIERRITAKPDAKMDGVVMLMHCCLLAGDGCSGAACDCRFSQRHFESVTTDENDSDEILTQVVYQLR